jgi:hypothetical protein
MMKPLGKEELPQQAFTLWQHYAMETRALDDGSVLNPHLCRRKNWKRQ